MATSTLLTHVEHIEEVLTVAVTLTRVQAAVTRGATLALGGVRADGGWTLEALTRDRSRLTHARHAWVGRAREARPVLVQFAQVEAVCG